MLSEFSVKRAWASIVLRLTPAINKSGAPDGVSSMASGRREHLECVGDLPPGSMEYYRYLEQDERLLAAISDTEEARIAHLRFANHYHELAVRAAGA